MSVAHAQSERGQEKVKVLNQALDAGLAILRAGGTALSAVEASVMVLEDAPVFNAGRGSVLRSDGSVRMDASLMCGHTLRAGAVASVTTVQHPVRLARWLAEDGRHVMLLGEEAEALAARVGHAVRKREYFITAERQEQLERLACLGGVALDHDVDDVVQEGQTVGAVALDTLGHLAAATSTGGLTNAAPGRVGDTPILGAGTWADDRSCAVSATGDGEFFIRTGFAHQVHGRCLYGHQNLSQSVTHALGQVGELGGKGGCIALNRAGHVVAPFTTTGMARAFVDGQGQRLVALVS